MKIIFFFLLRNYLNLQPIHLRGRLLFRSAVRLVIEYKDWINFEIDDDPATRDEEESLRARRDKKRKKIVVKKELSLKVFYITYRNIFPICSIQLFYLISQS